jgi:hypothetical protein
LNKLVSLYPVPRFAAVLSPFLRSKGAFTGIKGIAAFDAHKTQFGPENPIRQMPEALQRQLFARETFIQARPAPAVGAVQSTDLFA